jgi:propanol-preferring alcohol dehydrogenase
LFQGATVHVMTRSRAAQQLALDLGCASANDARAQPPEPLDAAVLFAPVGDIVPVALRALDRGGTLAIAGIHLTDVPALRYEDELFEERAVTSTTANTRRDGEELLELAVTVPLRVQTTVYPLARADVALRDLAHDRVTGAAVLHVGEGASDQVARAST